MLCSGVKSGSERQAEILISGMRQFSGREEIHRSKFNEVHMSFGNGDLVQPWFGPSTNDVVIWWDVSEALVRIRLWSWEREFSAASVDVILPEVEHVSFIEKLVSSSPP